MFSSVLFLLNVADLCISIQGWSVRSSAPSSLNVAVVYEKWNSSVKCGGESLT